MSLKRFGFFFLLITAIALVDFFYLERPTVGIDDANIFFTYARHLTHGEGFVFNSGGEKVEGFTSLLWVIICSVFYFIFSRPEFPLMLLLLVLTAATVTMVYDELKKDVDQLDDSIFKKHFLLIFSAFIICIGPPYITWSILSLMENGLWNFLFTWMVILVLQSFRLTEITNWKKIAMLVAGVLLIVTRPEGLAWIILFTILLVISFRRNRRQLIFPLIYFLVLAATSAALTYFRKNYFGYPFPNTYYAKVSHNILYNVKSGLQYAFGFIFTYHPLISFLLAMLIITAVKSIRIIRSKLENRQEQDFLLRLLVVFIIIVTVILLPLTTGGDHFGSFRFYQSSMLLLGWGLVAAYWLYDRIMTEEKLGRFSWTSITIFVVTLVVMTGSLYQLKSSAKTQLNYEFYLASSGRKTAEDFNTVWENKVAPSTGVVAVGGFSFRYKGETVDLMGLNNVRMGHSNGERTGVKNHAAFNKDVFYELSPDVLLPKELTDESIGKIAYTELLDRYNFDNVAMKHIFNDDAFQKIYQPVMVRRNNNGKLFFMIAKNDFVNKLQGDPDIQLIRINPN